MSKDPQFALAGIVIVAGVMAAGLTFASPGFAHPEPLGRTIAQAIEAEGPMITAGERALIREKCGYSSDEWNGSTLMVRNGTLICGNGRRVDDPEVRAAMERIGARARTHVEAVMSRPEIRRAISGEAQAQAREQMRRFETEQRPQIDAAIAQARAQVARIDKEQLRIQIERARAELDGIDFNAMEREIDQSVERGLREHRRHRRTD